MAERQLKDADGKIPITIRIHGGGWPDEYSWDINGGRDSVGGALDDDLAASGGTYANTMGRITERQVWLKHGDHNFNYFDSWDDGWNPADWGYCAVPEKLGRKFPYECPPTTAHPHGLWSGGYTIIDTESGEILSGGCEKDVDGQDIDKDEDDCAEGTSYTCRWAQKCAGLIAEAGPEPDGGGSVPFTVPRLIGGGSTEIASSCPAGYSGIDCGTWCGGGNINQYLDSTTNTCKTCLNGGTTNAGDIACTCPAGYSGIDCTDADCVGEWSACTAACELGTARTWSQTIAQSGTGTACPAAADADCQPGEGDCPSDCTGLTPPSNGSMGSCSATLAHGATCDYECGTGFTPEGSQPSCDDGTLTSTVTCVEDVDCVGAWGTCNADCEKTYAVSVTAVASGSSCEAIHGDVGTCAPGEDACPLNIDCDGSWSACTAACELGTARTWSQTIAQSGTGTACPAAADADCQPGEGDCPSDCTGLTPPSNGSMGSCSATLAHGATCDYECGTGFTPEGSQPSCDDGTLTSTVTCVACTHGSSCGSCLSGEVWDSGNVTGTFATSGTAQCVASADCVAGYSGANCQTNIDDCTPNPCQNGGTCADGVDSYTCTCLAGYYGIDCTDTDCVGAYGECTVDCRKTYAITTEVSGNGVVCPAADGHVEDCQPGEGDCPANCTGLTISGVMEWNDCPTDGKLDHNGSCTLTCPSTHTVVGTQPSCDDGTLTSSVSCEENTCTPFNTTFTETPVGYHVSTLSGTKTSELGLTCAPGYNGIPRVLCLTHGGAFSHPSGCEENTCNAFNITNPGGAPDGYIIPTISGTTVSDLGVLDCDQRYIGEPIITCLDNGGDFSAPTGCSPIVGKCSGNTDSSNDFTEFGVIINGEEKQCPENTRLNEGITGDTIDICCEHIVGQCSGNFNSENDFDCPENTRVKEDTIGNTSEVCCESRTHYCFDNTVFGESDITCPLITQILTSDRDKRCMDNDQSIPCTIDICCENRVNYCINNIDPSTDFTEYDYIGNPGTPGARQCPQGKSVTSDIHERSNCCNDRVNYCIHNLVPSDNFDCRLENPPQKNIIDIALQKGTTSVETVGNCCEDITNQCIENTDIAANVNCLTYTDSDDHYRSRRNGVCLSSTDSSVVKTSSGQEIRSNTECLAPNEWIEDYNRITYDNEDQKKDRCCVIIRDEDKCSAAWANGLCLDANQDQLSAHADHDIGSMTTNSDKLRECCEHIVGQCSGNTNPTEDFDCPENTRLNEGITGDTIDVCCSDRENFCKNNTHADTNPDFDCSTPGAMPPQVPCTSSCGSWQDKSGDPSCGSGECDRSKCCDPINNTCGSLVSSNPYTGCRDVNLKDKVDAVTCTTSCTTFECCESNTDTCIGADISDAGVETVVTVDCPPRMRLRESADQINIDSDIGGNCCEEITGMCSGNTDQSTESGEPDITCTAPSILKPNGNTITGRTPEVCCHITEQCGDNTDPTHDHPGCPDNMTPKASNTPCTATPCTDSDCCIEITGKCVGNYDQTNNPDISCIAPYELKLNPNTVVGRDILSCCEIRGRCYGNTDSAAEPSVSCTGGKISNDRDPAYPGSNVGIIGRDEATCCHTKRYCTNPAVSNYTDIVCDGLQGEGTWELIDDAATHEIDYDADENDPSVKSECCSLEGSISWEETDLPVRTLYCTDMPPDVRGCSNEDLKLTANSLVVQSTDLSLDVSSLKRRCCKPEPFTNMYENFSNKKNVNYNHNMMEGMSNIDYERSLVNSECNLIKNDIIKELGIVESQLIFSCELNQSRTGYDIKSNIVPTEGKPLPDDIKNKISKGIQLKSIGAKTKPKKMKEGNTKLLILLVIIITIIVLGGFFLFLK